MICGNCGRDATRLQYRWTKDGMKEGCAHCLGQPPSRIGTFVLHNPERHDNGMTRAYAEEIRARHIEYDGKGECAGVSQRVNRTYFI